MSSSEGSAVERQATRLDVRSADGTRLAVWVDGDGPPLAMVHGSPSDHTTFDPLVDALRGDMTTFAMDRRGSGASGDGPDFAIQREFEDVAAVVDAVADHDGGPVALFGHSYGANPAMGGAAATTNVHRVVLYEPSFGLAYPPGAALVETDVMTEEEFEALRGSPRWPKLLAAAPALPRECRVEDGWVYRPGQFDGITAPTLMLLGSDTAPALAEATRRAAAAIPDAEIRVLEGHGHFAFKTDPVMVATIILEFIAS